MKRIEYKTVMYEPGFGKRLLGDDFGDSLTQMLSEQGQEGWDLKAAIPRDGLTTLFIFGREEG